MLGDVSIWILVSWDGKVLEADPDGQWEMLVSVN